MSDDRDELDEPLGAEDRLRQMSTQRSMLPLAWLPVLLIVGAVGLLFWWLTQSIQPDRPRAIGTPAAIAFATSPPSSAAAPALPPSAGQPVSDVVRNRQRYLNEPISVTGGYRARDVQGELRGQAAVTANDWVLSDGSSAIWVTGRPPADLSLRGDTGIDTPLVVEGTLREIGGKLVLDARTVVVAGRAPVAAGGTPTVASASATGGKGIQPGGYVKVVGTGASQLSFRSGAGTSFGRVTEQPLLPDGTRLKVLEGPKKGEDGNNWWRLQSEKGVNGWAAEAFLEPTEAP